MQNIEESDTRVVFGSELTQELPEQELALSQHLVDARLDTRVLEAFPGDLPTSIEQAYGIQSASIAQWPDDRSQGQCWIPNYRPDLRRRLRGYRSRIRARAGKRDSAQH